MKRLRSLSAQLLLLIILPLFVVLLAVALGGVAVHQNSMREMVGDRDLRAVRTAAAGLVDQPLSPDNRRIRDLLAELQMSPQTMVMLVDRAGRAVYHTDAGRVGQIISHPGVAEALTGHSGTLYRADQPGGEEHVVAYAPVLTASENSVSGALIIEEPWAEVASPWLRTSLVAPLVLIPAVALALVAIWLGVQRVIRPLQKLDVQVKALGAGDFDAITKPVGGIEEIVELQTALAQMAAQVRAYQQSLRGYLGAVTAAQEEERRRLARELHDDTVQSLIALKQRIQAARRKASRDPSVLEGQLAELQAMLETTMDDVRRFSRALRPIYLDELGLVAALEMLTREVSQSGRLSVEFQCIGLERRLSPEAELALYRMAQEALSNVSRHAQASRAALTIAFDPGSVTLTVEDNGRGFAVPANPAEFAPRGHFGLLGLHERTELIGARLDLRSSPGQGTRLTVSLPTGE